MSDAICEIDSSQFGRHLLDLIGEKRVPLNGSICLTERCNLGCRHCYINEPAGDRGLIRRELTYAEIQSILDQIVAQGCLFLLLTGGEVFLRQDFVDIYGYAKRKGLLVTIFTNGTLITPEMADYLAEWPPYQVEISLYGATWETYESVTGVKGSFARCMRGIDLLADRGLSPVLKTMCLTINGHELQAMRDLARSLGLDFRYDAMVMPRADDRQEGLQYRLTSQEVVAIEMADAERWSEWRGLIEKYGWYPKVTGMAYNCGAGLRSFYIGPYGQLKLCGLVPGSGYDLRKGSFAEGWRGPVKSVRETRRAKTTKCGTCRLGALCTLCPAWTQLVHGDNETPVEFICQTAHLRAENLGFERLPELMEVQS